MKAIEAAIFAKRPVWKSILGVLLSWVVFANLADAHTLGQSYIYVNFQESGLSGRLELPIDSLRIVLRQKNAGFTLDNARPNNRTRRVGEPPRSDWSPGKTP
ncbi:MAG: hypothetical protein O7E57_11860 [Gammaproteobacteria bacterium]|nr:hypothetical protein [Gammaproteobacteria bacterium]